MLILWIHHSGTGKQTCHTNNGQNPFRQHDEDMQRFRLIHPIIESTGSKDIMTTDEALLAPVQPVKLAKHSCN